jgi:hypothetical protein
MATLVINAPKQKAESESKRSFEQTFASAVGQGYAIARHLSERCHPGCRVVLLSKDEGKRAEGRLVKLAATCKACSSMDSLVKKP